jgi:hypothetical protein
MEAKMNLKDQLMQASLRAEAKEWKPASEKQINFICALHKEGFISSEDVAIKDGFCLTSSSASKLINAGLEAKNKPVVVTEDDDNIPF